MTSDNDDAEEAKEDDQDVSFQSQQNRERRVRNVERRSYLWLLSFTDVMALMLTFFVLLFSMSTPDEENWSEVTSALYQELNRFYGALLNKGPIDTESLEKLDFGQALDIYYLRALTESMIKKSESLQVVTITQQEDHLILSLPHDLLFEPADATVKESGSRAIYALGGILSRIKNNVEVIGHADPRPIQGKKGKYDNNWELSLARAANVAALLDSVGYNRDVAIRGLSSGRYEDLEDVVSDEEERLRIARRVDIIIRDHDGSKRKVFFILE